MEPVAFRLVEILRDHPSHVPLLFIVDEIPILPEILATARHFRLEASLELV